MVFNRGIKAVVKTVRNNHILTKDGNFALRCGTVILILTLFAAFLGPILAPHEPSQVQLANRLLEPSLRYPLGTDSLGRCVFSRLVTGLRTSLLIAVIILALRLVIGVLLGILAGYLEGFLGQLIARLVDLELAFPAIMSALVIVGMLGNSVFHLVVALSIVGWSKYTRVLRSVVISLKQKEYILAAQATGADNLSIMYRHILPNSLWPTIPLATLGFGNIIVYIGGLSFLGLGVSQGTPELGVMIQEGYQFFPEVPRLVLLPSLLIVLSVTSFTLIGDGFRDLLDPKTQNSEINTP